MIQEKIHCVGPVQRKRCGRHSFGRFLEHIQSDFLRTDVILTSEDFPTYSFLDILHCQEAPFLGSHFRLLSRYQETFLGSPRPFLTPLYSTKIEYKCKT